MKYESSLSSVPENDGWKKWFSPVKHCLTFKAFLAPLLMASLYQTKLRKLSETFDCFFRKRILHYNLIHYNKTIVHCRKYFLHQGKMERKLKK